MKGKNVIIMIVVVVLIFLSGQLNAEEVVGKSIFPNIETPYTYSDAAGKALVWSTTIQEPGAAWIKIHFSRFWLNQDDYVDLLDRNGILIERISGRDVSKCRLSRFKVEKNGNNCVSFWASSIDRDEVIVELYRESNKLNDCGFIIDEVGVGFKPIFDRGLGPIYKLEEKNDNPIIAFGEKNTSISGSDFLRRTINILDSPKGKLLYRKDTTWYTCNVSLLDIDGNYILPGEPVIDSQEVVNTTEVRFYYHHSDKNKSISTYFTYFVYALVDDPLSTYDGMLITKTNPQYTVEWGKKNPISRFYEVATCYIWAECPYCHMDLGTKECTCPCGPIELSGSCCGHSYNLSCECD